MLYAYYFYMFLVYILVLVIRVLNIYKCRTRVVIAVLSCGYPVCSVRGPRAGLPCLNLFCRRPPPRTLFYQSQPEPLNPFHSNCVGLGLTGSAPLGFFRAPPHPHGKFLVVPPGLRCILRRVVVRCPENM